ncbi:hypothetical protein B0G75_103677 [Paraburkholderia sp. BL18I3N2]|uniref:hypothetical protein n=1 Tax=Paraburkholderia sp. BL18I3N2 TaxID=1938799 RepID=UPI000D462A89|nr:hypothetical protein [Paraburkholderia sp. BL18I3N2]PRX33449.1 hypothetical protein B0G75_103677 [Paraburkholderia sp. BL18I3N2]
MRRIDAEYDIPQFLASSLVRTIAASDFRLPESKREKFQKLPDDVIARIEDIVRQAYIEAGEDVGGDILRAHLWRQALDGRRAMIASGELLPPTEFRRRIGVTEKRLEKLLNDGSLFSVEVDGVQYVPAVLAGAAHNLRRLQTICRVIASAPPLSRLDFLTSRNGTLADQRPLDMLKDNADFKTLRQAAAAWAAEWSRTVVKLYEGMHETAPSDVSPLYTASAEIDPRRPLWERASEALHVHGYQWPLGPYPDVRSFTLFIERHTFGGAAPMSEACVQILVDGEDIRIRVVAPPGATLSSKIMPAGNPEGPIDIAKRVIAHLTNAKRT